MPAVWRRIGWVAMAVLIGLSRAGLAETDTVRIQRPIDLATLPLLVAEHEKLIEKAATQRGLKRPTIKWSTPGKTGPLDALAAGQVDLVATDIVPLLISVEATADKPQQVRGLLAERSDLLVWLDLSKATVMRQVVRRTLRRGLGKQELWNGNVEPPLRTVFTDPDHIVRWAWKTHHENAERVMALHQQRSDSRNRQGSFVGRRGRFEPTAATIHRYSDRGRNRGAAATILLAVPGTIKARPFMNPL